MTTIDEQVAELEKALPHMAYPYALSFSHSVNDTGTEFEYTEIIIDCQRLYVVDLSCQRETMLHMMACANAVPALLSEIRRLRTLLAGEDYSTEAEEAMEAGRQVWIQRNIEMMGGEKLGN